MREKDGVELMMEWDKQTKEMLKGYQPPAMSKELNRALLEPIKDRHSSDWIYDRLMEQIRDFEEKLDDNSELALMLAYFGQSVLLNVTEIGYQKPDMLYFYGIVDNRPAQLIQHVHQLNFLLTSVPKLVPEKPPKRISLGFQQPNED